MVRPIVWTEDKIDQLVELINNYIDEASTREPQIIPHDKGVTIIPPDIPNIEECLFKIAYNNKYVYELANKHQTLADALSRVRELNALYLQKYGINGQYNPVITKLAMINNRSLGWTDKSEVDSNINIPNKIVLDMSNYKPKEPKV